MNRPGFFLRSIPLIVWALMLNACTPAPPDRGPGDDPTVRGLPPESWADRLTADDPRVRAAATTELVAATPRSLPLLRRLLHAPDEGVRLAAFDVVYRIGPRAIPLLTEMLADERVTNRRAAADLLIDFAPDTESVQAPLCRALKDQDEVVARDAARALGALREKARPSIPPLREALSHDDAHVRLYAAEAIASIGGEAAGAVGDLGRLLRDPVPGVRWAACEALGSIGPAAAPAVPQLIEALNDESLYVRICAAEALGNIGPRAGGALPSLERAAADPAMSDGATRAIGRIAAADATRPAAVSADGSTPTSRSNAPTVRVSSDPVPPAGNPPVDWDTDGGRNVLWSVALGNQTFGRPVVAGGAVYVGTDNAACRNPGIGQECGVLLAFGAAGGEFLWQDVAPRVGRGLREFLLPSTTSAPYVEGDRLYYLTSECQLRCLDTRGFQDGVNDGAYQAEPFRDAHSADVVWELDLCARLGVFPHEACNSEVLPVGDLLVICTSNGRNEGHTRVPSPLAPSVIAVDKRSGEVVWRAVGPGRDVLHGQWSSPTVAVVNGRPQVLFGGGDGWLRAYDAASGSELWRFDGNPKDAVWRPRPGVFSRGAILASPVCADGRVFVAMGEDPSHGDGPSLLHAVRPDGRGDVTDSGRLWTCDKVGRVVGTPIVSDGLLYVGDLGGKVHCIDAATGAVTWNHETHGAIWGCLVLAGGRLYAGNEDGRMTVLRAGRRKELIAEFEMDAPLYSRPAVVGDAMYLATARRLYLIASIALRCPRPGMD